MRLHTYPPTFEETGAREERIFANPMYSGLTRTVPAYDMRLRFILEHEGRAVTFRATEQTLPEFYEIAKASLLGNEQ